MQRISELESEIQKHRKLYYEGNPYISDAAYDALEEELEKLDPKNKILQQVGFAGGKVRHQIKMLSLDKTYCLSDLGEWIENREVISVYKIDGVSGSLIYKKGKLFLAKTRGNGVWGEDITEKMQKIPSIPQKINASDMEVRGEIYCDPKSFEKLCDEMEKLNLPKPSNPRNIVAGLMGRKDHIDLCRFLSFKAFTLISSEKFKKEDQKISRLKELKFKIPSCKTHKDMKGVNKVLESAKTFMQDESKYKIDGVVFCYNDISLQNELGETSHHPRYKIAFKFAGESKQTKIRSIEWQTSRNGILTPVGSVDPVELSGALVSRVTFHNFGTVREHNLKPGDTIEIVRSGEVIPKFLSRVESSNKKFNYPKKCPSCQGATKEDNIRLICPNFKCGGRLKASILYFIQKMGIDDISMKRIEEMLKENLIRGIADLYLLTPEKLMQLDGFKETLAQKLVDAIQKSKSTDLVTFMAALGIQGGAVNKCEKIVFSGYDTIDKVKKMTIDQLVEVDSFAEKSAGEFIAGIQKKIPLINELTDLGVRIKAPKKIKDNPYKGKKICITGSLSTGRSQVENIIRNMGAVVVSSVSKNTDFLLTNDKKSNSSKFKKAKTLDIPIISEKDIIP